MDAASRGAYAFHWPVITGCSLSGSSVDACEALIYPLLLTEGGIDLDLVPAEVRRHRFQHRPERREQCAGKAQFGGQASITSVMAIVFDVIDFHFWYAESSPTTDREGKRAHQS